MAALTTPSASSSQGASELVRRVGAGEEIDITVAGLLAARLVPAQQRRYHRWSDIAGLFAGDVCRFRSGPRPQASGRNRAKPLAGPVRAILDTSVVVATGVARFDERGPPTPVEHPAQLRPLPLDERVAATYGVVAAAVVVRRPTAPSTSDGPAHRRHCSRPQRRGQHPRLRRSHRARRPHRHRHRHRLIQVQGTQRHFGSQSRPARRTSPPRAVTPCLLTKRRCGSNAGSNWSRTASNGGEQRWTASRRIASLSRTFTDVYGPP